VADLAGLLAALPAPEHTPERVRDAIDEVLSRPEFAGSQPSPLQRAWSAVLSRIGEVLFGMGTPGGTVLGVVVLVVILAVIGVLIARFARTMTADPELAAAVALTPARTAAQWQAEAAEREAAGDWRGGLRCRYRALVATLAARGLVEEVPGTTTGEYRGQVARNVPAATTAFAGATELFELAWYGNRPTGAGEADRFATLAGDVLDRAAR
jgi:hypothetical protein